MQREAKKIAERVAADVLAVADADSRVVASGGRLAASWPRGVDIEKRTEAPARRGIAPCRSAAACITWSRVPLQLGEATIGSLELGTALDAITRASWPICRAARRQSCRGDTVLASTVGGPAARDLAVWRSDRSRRRNTMTLAGESWAIQPLSQLGDVTFLALASIDAAAAGQTQAALHGLAGSGLARWGWPFSAASGWRGR